MDAKATWASESLKSEPEVLSVCLSFGLSVCLGLQKKFLSQEKDHGTPFPCSRRSQVDNKGRGKCQRNVILALVQEMSPLHNHVAMGQEIHVVRSQASADVASGWSHIIVLGSGPGKEELELCQWQEQDKDDINGRAAIMLHPSNPRPTTSLSDWARTVIQDRSISSVEPDHHHLQSHFHHQLAVYSSG